MDMEGIVDMPNLLAPVARLWEDFLEIALS